MKFKHRTVIASNSPPLLETLESRRLMAETLPSSSSPLLPLSSGATSAAVTATPTVVAPQRIYLTGNSMTDGVRYTGLAELLGRGGASVSLGRQTGSGYSQAYNLRLRAGYFTSGIDPAQPGTKDPWGNYQQAFANPWDTLTLQPHDRRLLDHDNGFGNEADVPMTIAFMQRVASNSPGARVFAYSRPARRTDLDASSQPTGIAFDYAAEWNMPYVDSSIAGVNPNHYISRSYVQQFMPLARTAQQNDATARNMKPLRLIPVGEAYYNVDQMIKAGKFAGTYVKSIKDFYVDQSHPTATASYVIALSFYASITGNDPRGVAPTSNYLNAAPALADPKVQALLQQAVYDAMTFGAYAGWITPLPAPGPGTGSGSIAGALFDDADADGVRDSGEAPLSNWKLYIDADKDGVLDAGESTALTDSAGNYRFASLPAGTYRVREVISAGWRRTAPSSGYHDVSLVAGQAATGKTFGNTTQAKLTGSLLNDLDANGAWNAGESGLSAWRVFLDTDKDGVLDATERSTLTGSSGAYAFDNLAPGSYRIGIVQPTGWRRTTAASASDLTLAGGATASRTFAFTQKILISGSVFNDANGDRIRNTGEVALANWRVFIDSDGDGVWDSTEKYAFSDASGNYSFKTLSAGTYKVRVVQQSGWTRTTPTAGYHSITLASGGTSTGKLFGEKRIG